MERQEIKEKIASVIAAFGVEHHDKRIRKTELSMGGYVLINCRATARAIAEYLFEQGVNVEDKQS